MNRDRKWEMNGGYALGASRNRLSDGWIGLLKRAFVFSFACALLASVQVQGAGLGTLTAENGKTFVLKIAGDQKPYQLIVYSDTGKELGYYPVVDKPDRIEGHKVIFDYASVDGNTIPFKKGPPKTIELDTAQVAFQTGLAAAMVSLKKGGGAPLNRTVPDPEMERAARSRLESRNWNRIVESFNHGWVFALANEITSETAEEIPPPRWRRVDLPHDWGVEHPVHGGYPSGSSGGFTKAGLGWYRKTFTVPDDWNDRRVFIDFGGVFMNSDVWINGKWLGHRPYGFTSFRYDLTPFLEFNAPNEIKVRVDNTLQRSARWYTGSGIYRDVNLVVTDPVHVDNWGTYVQTPQVSEKEATVVLKTKIANTLNTSGKITVRTTVAGQTVESKQHVESLEKEDVVQILKISNPRLWSLEQPNLYTVVTEVLVNGETLDRYETPMGIRTLEFDAGKGFLLNGKSVNLKGVCIHEDGGGAVGTAVPIEVWERRFRILQEMGCNAVRCSHNPFRTAFYDLADRMGMLVIDEAFDEWKVGKREHAYADYFEEWAERDLVDMMKRNRNHPSIFMWSIGNEIRDIREPGGADTAAWLSNIVKKMDRSRPTTIGLNHTPEEGDPLYDAVDHIGINFGHHVADKKNPECSKYDRVHEEHAGRFIYGSETTHSFQTRGVYKTLTFRKNTTKQPHLAETEIFNFDPNYNSSYDNAFIEHHNRYTLNYMRQNPWLAGEFRWTGIDYLGEAGNFPSRFKSFGIIDMCGFPKDAYYLYQSTWTDRTVLHVLPHWNWEGMEGTEIPVWIYANQCDEVELFVNGKSQGRKVFDEQQLYVAWDVPYAPGELRAISYKAGRKVQETLMATAGKPASIELLVDKNEIRPNHRDIIHAQVRILDADGNFVPTAGNTIEFSVSGPAGILGVDNGDPLDHDPLKAERRKTFNGRCLAIIQSGFEEGDVVIRAESPGLESAQSTVAIKGTVPDFSHSYTVPAEAGYEVSTYEMNLCVPGDHVETKSGKKKRVK